MRVFACVIAAHALAFGLIGSANAADMFSLEDDVCGSWKDDPCEKPVLWSGFYFGGFIGGGRGSSDVEDEYTYNDNDPLALNTIDLSALMAGLNVGYNVQKGNYVIGVEAGLGFMNFKDSVTDSDLRPDWAVQANHDPIGATYSISGNLYGEVTGKIGYAKDETLIYAKGGGAFLQTSFDAHYVGQNCSTASSYTGWASDCWGSAPQAKPSVFDFGKDDTLFGWTVGLGLEHAINNRMSLKLEYQHFDFGSVGYKYNDTVTYGTTNGNRNWTATLNGDVEADVTLDVVKLGVNYKLQD